MAAKPPAARAEVDTAGRVQSISRALAILRALAESGDGMTLSDVAQMVGLPASTAHRLLTTLQQERFVRFDGTAHLWQVGVGAFIVGNAFARTRDAVAMARPYLRRLMEEGGETANLYLEQDGEAICMAQVECRQMMRAIARPGGRVKMHCSGAGKAMLGWTSDAELTRVVRQHGLTRFTERTLDTPTRLRRDLEQVRQRGYAVDDEEHAVGLRCVAAPVFDEHGQPVAALSLSGPGARIDEARLAELGTLAARVAAEFSAELGGHSVASRSTPESRSTA
ncbi:MAG: IclR family transcriptional regulator C-terminal domain-containing protein [Geminicoccaceae bacterium]